MSDGTQFEALFNHAPLGIYLVDADFRIRQVNPIALSVFGTVQDLIGRDFDEVMHILWPKAFADEVAGRFRHTLESGEPFLLTESIEERFDIEVKEYYEWEIYRVPLPEGRDGVVCYFRDISKQVLARRDLEQTEAALLKSEKLAVVGRLASTIAHEINNPLAAVMNIIWLLRTDGSMPVSACKLLKTADAELSRVAHLTHQTLSFSRGGGATQLLNYSEAVDDILGILSLRILNKNATITKEVDSTVSLAGVRGDLRQILANLISNSLDAIPTGGSIWVRVHPAKRNNRQGVRLTIADNGTGIPQAARHRVFEPFFTLKVETGTGLGLWVTTEIVKRHQGFIQAHSSTRPGHSGTVVSIFFPEKSSKLRAAATNSGHSA